MKIKCTLTEEILGTASANPDIHREFIASKSADAEKMKEELESLPADQLALRQMTVFHRDTDNQPILFDYQIKGFLKEAIGILCELPDYADIKFGKSKLSKYTFKRLVDNYIFVSPRKLRLSEGTGANCVRPLKAETPKGERVSLATSETVPAGATFECEIKSLVGGTAIDDLIRDALNYGQLKGLGCWRNSGKGRFEWEKIVTA